MHPMKVSRNIARLVGLHGADEVPGDVAPGEKPQLGQRFLQVVLAEVANAHIGGSRDFFGRAHFRHGKQAYVGA